MYILCFVSGHLSYLFFVYHVYLGLCLARVCLFLCLSSRRGPTRLVERRSEPSSNAGTRSSTRSARVYMHIHINIHMHKHIYIYTYVCLSACLPVCLSACPPVSRSLALSHLGGLKGSTIKGQFRKCGLRPVHLLRVSLLRVLESNFPGDPL